MAFDLKNYEDVQSRVRRWTDSFPLGRICTEIISFDSTAGTVLVKASVYRDDETEKPAGVDYAYGHAATYPAHMRRFFVEDTVTSAIGRAINLVIPGDFKATVQDMQKVNNNTSGDYEDFWTVKDVTDEIRPKLGQPIEGEAPVCAHGHMILKEGIKKDTGKPYRGYICTERNKDRQCKPMWQIQSATTGEWRFQDGVR